MAETRKSSPREGDIGQSGEGRRGGGGTRGGKPPRKAASTAGRPSPGGASPNDPDRIPDTELVGRAAQGRPDAFEPLVRRYSDIIVRFAHHMVGDFQAAEDIAQESFLKAFSHLGRLAEPEKFSTWLYSITRHLCLDWIRSKRSMLSVEVLEDDGVEVTDERGPPPDRSAETDEMHGAVLRELGQLRADYREILLMKHVYELSYKEISEIEGLSVSAVGEKLSRVRQMLRRKLVGDRSPDQAS